MNSTMKSLSKIDSGNSPVFLDTSVVINLLAAGCMETIQATLNRPLIIPEEVAGELTHDPRDNSDGRTLLAKLKQQEAIAIHQLTDEQLAHFFSLVSAESPDDLGDGEAATLACAISHGNAAIDERKARRIAVRDHNNVMLFSSLDLLCSPHAYKFYGVEVVEDMVRKAVTIGRMRIPPEWRSFVASLMMSAVGSAHK